MSHNPNDIFDPKRYGLITGSRCSVLFPKRSAEVGQRQYAKELANNMYFRFYDNNSTWQTEHGNLSESTAFEYFQERFDKTAQHQPTFMALEDWGGQADCVCDDYGVDFKCPTSLKGWLDYLHEGISDEQFHQCQMYMFLYDKPKWLICAFLLETNKMSENGDVYPVPHKNRMIMIEVEREPTWELKLREITPKITAMRNFFYDKLQEQFS